VGVCGHLKTATGRSEDLAETFGFFLFLLLKASILIDYGPGRLLFFGLEGHLRNDDGRVMMHFFDYTPPPH
jgi:hypothetical protein